MIKLVVLIIINFDMNACDAYRMQVEVSKYTEGAKEKARRPNGLPESLIRYDGTGFNTHHLVTVCLRVICRLVNQACWNYAKQQLGFAPSFFSWKIAHCIQNRL